MKRLLITLFIVILPVVLDAQITSSATLSLMPASDDLLNDFNLSKLNPNKLDESIEKLRKFAYMPNAPISSKIDLAAFLLLKIEINIRAPYENIEDLFLETSDLVPGNYFLEKDWGWAFFFKGDYEKSLDHFRLALSKKPNDLLLTGLAGLAAMQAMQYETALDYFQVVYSTNKKNFGLLYSMGRCNFELKYIEDAIDYWTQAREVAENEGQKKAVDSAIRKAKELLASTSGGTSEETQRFVIHFAGDSEDDLGDVTTDLLEEIYDQVTDDLGFKPDVKVYVTFFLTKDYYKINKNWSAGAASGLKIMIPLKSGYKSTEYVKGLLAHEFTHAVIYVLTKNRCPLWLNEGMAQYEEFYASFGSHETLRPDYEGIFQSYFVDGQKTVPLSKVPAYIQGSGSRRKIALGYIASYMAVRFIVDRYYESCLADILADLGKGKTIDEAINDNTNNEDMSDFQSDFDDWLRNY